MMPFSRSLVVVTAASTHDLTTRDALKRDLRITASTWDDLLDDLIHRSSAVCATYCNRVFARETVTETFWLEGKIDTLNLARFPNIAIASLIEDDAALVASDYAVDEQSGSLWRVSAGARIKWDASKIVVTYAAGYELLDDLPRDIEEACIRQSRVTWYAGGRDPLVKAEEVPGVSNVQYWVGGVGEPGTLSPDVTALLDPHRNPAIL